MADILLLNASYEPLAVITKQRAISLIMKGRVDAACKETIELRSVRNSLHIPTAIRPHHYVNVPRRGVRWSRKAVLQRDKYTCVYCSIQLGGRQRGKRLIRRHFTIDHIIPVSRGGKNSWVNTVGAACQVCNQLIQR